MKPTQSPNKVLAQLQVIMLSSGTLCFGPAG
jgi:hypothetical protein